MKIKVEIMLLALTGFFCCAQSELKQPAVVKNVVSSINSAYSIVRTTVNTNPSIGQGAIIQRQQLGIVSLTRKDSGTIDVALDVPTLDMKTYNTSQWNNITNKLASLVGAVSTNPKGLMAGAGVSSMGILTDYATQVAERELNDSFGAQGYFTILEIFPTLYYQLNPSTNKIEVTNNFLEDFPKYQNLLRQLIIAYGLQGEGASADMLPPYRIAIMASPVAGGASCGTSGKGPWELTMTYYVGARQTHKMSVQFCVPNVKDYQHLQVSLVPNEIERGLMSGGVKFISKSNINFVKQMVYDARDIANAGETVVFRWPSYASLPGAEIVKGDITQFLLPFDIYGLKQAYMADPLVKQDSRLNMILGIVINEVIDRVEKTKKEIMAEMGGF